jgi:FMN reductase
MHIVSLSGSSSLRSRSRWLLQLAKTRLEGNASTSNVIAVRELPSDALLDADTHAEPIRRAIEHIRRADLLLIATPIYKAAYSGRAAAGGDQGRGRGAGPRFAGGSWP